MVLPLISSSSSSSSRSTRMRNLKNSISTLGVNHFNLGSSGISSKYVPSSEYVPNEYQRNAISFSRTDCTYPLVRSKLLNSRFSHCQRVGFSGIQYIDINDANDFLGFPNCKQGLSSLDIIWFGELNDPVATSKNKIKMTPGTLDVWTAGNIWDMKKIAETTNNGVNKYICSDAGIDLNPNYKE